MLVCICKGLSERAVKETIDAGASSVEAIGKACGAGTDCGTCQGALEAMLDMNALVSPTRLVECRRTDRADEAQCASPERDAA